jgi:thiamine-monophosphate kinase
LLCLTDTDAELLPVSGMDSSDGLADELLQITAASGTGAAIDPAKVTISPALLDWVAPAKALEWALYGGEDFELVLCLPPSIAEQLVEKLGNHSAIIGTIRKETGVCLVQNTGLENIEYLTERKGFEHFKF